MTTIDSQPTTTHPHRGVRQDILDNVEKILPVLARNADRTETERKLPDESWNALIESDALRIWQPRRFGGQEANYRTYVDVTVKVAGACGSSGWLCFILNHTDWQLGGMSLAAQEAVWGNGLDAKILGPLSPAPGVQARRVDGGTVVSGEWPYSSGSERAKFALIGYPVVTPEGIPYMECGLISLDVVSEIKDTWFVAGMAGTNSNTIVVPETFIPDEHLITMPEMITGQFRTPFTEEPLYRQDVATVFHVATLPPVLGLAKAAFDLTREKITTKNRPLTYTMYTDATKAPNIQAAMAEAGWLIDTALEQTRAIADDLDARAEAGVPVEPVERARHIMQIAKAHRSCRTAMDLVLDVGGAGSFASGNPVQRMWRDMSVASRHGLSVPGVKEELYGRALLGADEQQMTPIR
ncbi:acyl-CoA dehydrogenase [Pseudonocardia sulfidoxydans NBRC 16205]|uniref:Acyl-CoA dehydrogenase n=1 Tax=Pseudonocardia sulfidoxydans NBRC 16205 TaxID=1223511 RepID=A0A511DC46_9PSEU|nr:oxidoreductase [Pseudonocardia sulfidoxydans]GEL21244.1 acyl-CoA dehydrogenase [Pseudonocardia sulfidoxydans NBRC 16205]